MPVGYDAGSGVHHRGADNGKVIGQRKIGDAGDLIQNIRGVEEHGVVTVIVCVVYIAAGDGAGPVAIVGDCYTCLLYTSVWRKGKLPLNQVLDAFLFLKCL